MLFSIFYLTMNKVKGRRFRYRSGICSQVKVESHAIYHVTKSLLRLASVATSLILLALLSVSLGVRNGSVDHPLRSPCWTP